MRAREFLPQLATPRDPSKVAVGSGLALIALGLVKKVVIADYLARTVVDPVFAVPEAYGAPDVLLAAYAYTAQIYCDFSGYTDMAIGLALLMGYVFPQNFRRPYRATGFRDFWRRWHMTLSRFLRDFLYIPLGGNRGGRVEDLPQPDAHDAARRALARRGVDVRALGRVPRRRADGRARARRPAAARPALVAVVVTFHLVVLGWILFRSPSLEQRRRVPRRGCSSPGAATLWTVPVVPAIVVVIGLQLLPAERVENLQMRLETAQAGRCSPSALAIVIACVGATVPSQGVPPFIYFRF